VVQRLLFLLSLKVLILKNIIIPSPSATSGLTQRTGRAAQAPGLTIWQAGPIVRPCRGSLSARCPYVGPRAWLTPG